MTENKLVQAEFYMISTAILQNIWVTKTIPHLKRVRLFIR